MLYESLAELKAAYENGDLHRDYKILIDNDCAFVSAPADAEMRRLPMKQVPLDSRREYACGGVEVWSFDGGPRELLFEAFDLLYMPSDGV